MKCVMIIDQNLPLGLIANTSAVLAMSIGDKVKGIVGEDVWDKGGTLHRGITKVSIPLLKGNAEIIRSVRKKVEALQDDSLFFVDFCDVAQRSKHYDHYKEQLGQTAESELNYLGLAIYGPKKQINSLTGSIGLLR